MPLLADSIIASTDLEQIIKGATVNFQVQILHRRTRQPFPLSEMTAATLKAGNADGTVYTQALTRSSIVDNDAGLLGITIQNTDSALLASGPAQSLELTLSTSGTNGAKIVIIDDVEVLEQVY